MAEMVTMVDALHRRSCPQGAIDRDLTCLLPATLPVAVWRGVKGRCPRCACTKLCERFLKPVSRCVACGEDWQLRSSDDFPPYIVILVLGHIIVPAMVAFEALFRPPTWVHLVIWLPLVAILGACLIQPVKGGVMAVQWWLARGGEGDFQHVPEMLPEVSAPEPAPSARA